MEKCREEKFFFSQNPQFISFLFTCSLRSQVLCSNSHRFKIDISLEIIFPQWCCSVNLIMTIERFYCHLPIVTYLCIYLMFLLDSVQFVSCRNRPRNILMSSWDKLINLENRWTILSINIGIYMASISWLLPKILRLFSFSALLKGDKKLSKLSSV